MRHIRDMTYFAFLLSPLCSVVPNGSVLSFLQMLDLHSVGEPFFSCTSARIWLRGEHSNVPLLAQCVQKVGAVMCGTL